jgi:hypothetical protein
MQIGDLPERLARRYLVEAGVLGPAKVYVDPTSKEPAFTDAGSRLSSDRTNPNTIRDLVDIAQHRGWSSITVRGALDFRREAWMEARGAGLDVEGYKPRPRDLQALEQRLAPRDRRAEATRPDECPVLTEFVEGKFLAKGEGPHCNRPGAPSSAFIRLGQADGKTVEIWSPALLAPLRALDARVGEHVKLQRNDHEFTLVDVRTGELHPTQMPGSRRSHPPGEERAARFHALQPIQRASDPELRAAQSHLSLLTAVARHHVPPGQGRDKLEAELKDMVAGRIAAGREFGPVQVRMTEPISMRERDHNAARERTRAR